METPGHCPPDVIHWKNIYTHYRNPRKYKQLFSVLLFILCSVRWRTSFLPVSLLTDSSGQKAVSLSDSYPTEKLCTFHVWAPTTTIFVPRLQFFTQLSNADSFRPSILRPLFSEERKDKSLVMHSAVCVCENAAHAKGSLRHAPLISASTSSSAAFERDKNNHPRWGLLRWAAAYVAAWETDINRMKWSKQRRGSVWNLFIFKCQA